MDKSGTPLASMTSIMLLTTIKALTKQPGIDLEKFTKDISQALLVHETSSESKPEGIPRAHRNDYVLMRAMLKLVLPTLPIR